MSTWTGKAASGPELAGEDVKGEVVTGEVVTGEVVQGEVVQGDVVKGDVVKGEDVKGEVVKRDAVSGVGDIGNVAAGGGATGKAGTGQTVLEKAGKEVAGTRKAETGKAETGKALTGKAGTGEAVTGEVIEGGGMMGKVAGDGLREEGVAGNPAATDEVTGEAVASHARLVNAVLRNVALGKAIVGEAALAKLASGKVSGLMTYTGNAPTVDPASEIRVAGVVARLHDDVRLAAGLIYVAGLRTSDCLRLRFRDLGPDCLYLHGNDGLLRDIVQLPASLAPAVAAHLERRGQLFEADRAAGVRVEVPDRIVEGVDPTRSFAWHYLFAAPELDVRRGGALRVPLPGPVFAAAFRRAARAEGLSGRISPQWLRDRHAEIIESRQPSADPQEEALFARHGDANNGFVSRYPFERLCAVLQDPVSTRH